MADPGGGVAQEPWSETLRRALPWIALSLLLTAAVRPAWRARDPGLAARAAVLEALEAGAERDPWGAPWRTDGWRSLSRETVTRSSSGPDGAPGGDDDVWVGGWSDEPLQQEVTLRAFRDTLPEAYRRVWQLPVWGWQLGFLLLGADRLLRHQARKPHERIGLLLLTSALAGVIGLLLAALLLQGGASWQPFTTAGALKPHLLPGLPELLRPSLPRAAATWGLLVGTILWLRAREAWAEQSTAEAALDPAAPDPAAPDPGAKGDAGG